ncbi:hypothetical protein DSUL_60247 [Desulfovibrionales bacterium]
MTWGTSTTAASAIFGYATRSDLILAVPMVMVRDVDYVVYAAHDLENIRLYLFVHRTSFITAREAVEILLLEAGYIVS